MKILILSHAQYITVGLQKIIEYAETLADLGHDVTLCVTSKTNRTRVLRHKANGVNIIESPSLLFGRLRHGADLYDAFKRYLVLKRNSYDIIHCVASRPTVYYPSILLKKRQGIKLIYEWEDSFGDGGVARERGGRLYNFLFGWIEKYFEESILKYADGVVVVSEYLKERALRLGVGKERLLKQIKGTRFIDYEFPDKRDARSEILPEAERDAIIFTYVGSIYKADLHLLIGAFAKICELYPRVRLKLVGYNGKLPAIIPRYMSILPRVPFDKYLENLAITDVFLLPLKYSVANISRYPSKFGDYLAAGRPVISTPLPEIENIINMADCGYVSIDDTAEEFFSVILKAIEDRDRWDKLGRNAYDYAIKHLSWDSITRRTVSMYANLMNN